jgi:uncharacterized protein
VLDEAKVLGGGHVDLLNQRIQAISDRGAGQIGVLLTNDLRGKSRNELAPEVFRAWGIGYGDRGPTGRGRGVLILVKVAQPDRGVRIEVGRDLEGRLNDGKTGEIMRSAIPSFREGSWYEGLSGLVDLLGAEMIAEANAVGAPVAPAAVAVTEDVRPSWLLPGTVFLGLPLLFLLWGAFLLLRWWMRYAPPISFSGGPREDWGRPDGERRQGRDHEDHSSWSSSSSSHGESSSSASSGRDSGRFGGGGDSGGGGSDSSF